MKPRTARQRVRGEGGIATVEFLLAFMPIFLLMVGLVQLALISTASIMVKHAAWRAARAAIVVLPDDHETADYAGDAVNRVGNGDGLDAYRNAHPDGRLAQIRKVARIILSPLAPSSVSLDGSTIADSLSADTFSLLAGLSLWTEQAIAVTFPDGEGGYRAGFGGRDAITVTVTCLFPCAVPMVSSFMCDTWEEIEDAKRQRLESNSAGGWAATAASGGRVVALEATATLPNQGL